MKDIEKAPPCDNTDIMFLVKTARNNSVLRKFIRKSHMEQAMFATSKSKLLFIIGQATIMYYII